MDYNPYQNVSKGGNKEKKKKKKKKKNESVMMEEKNKRKTFVFNRVEMVNVEYMIINILRTRHISNNHRVNS